MIGGLTLRTRRRSRQDPIVNAFTNFPGLDMIVPERLTILWQAPASRGSTTTDDADPRAERPLYRFGGRDGADLWFAHDRGDRDRVGDREGNRRKVSRGLEARVVDIDVRNHFQQTPHSIERVGARGLPVGKLGHPVALIRDAR